MYLVYTEREPSASDLSASYRGTPMEMFPSQRVTPIREVSMSTKKSGDEGFTSSVDVCVWNTLFTMVGC